MPGISGRGQFREASSGEPDVPRLIIPGGCVDLGDVTEPLTPTLLLKGLSGGMRGPRGLCSGLIAELFFSCLPGRPKGKRRRDHCQRKE